MFGLKELFARSKPIQYTSYVIVLGIIAASKLYSRDDVNQGQKEITEQVQEIAVKEAEAKIVTTVDRVIDGDTIIAGGVRYRLALIDAPEIDQPFGNEAAAFLRGLVKDTEIILEGTHRDQYGRTVSKASISGISIAEVMIENGYAWAYMVPDNYENTLFKLQDSARDNGLGLWVDTQPIRPSIFRETKYANQ